MRDVLITESILIVFAILVVIFSQPVQAEFTAIESVHTSNGSVHVNNAQTIKTGDNLSRVFRAGDQYSEINAGQQIVTGPGNSQYDTEMSMTSGYKQNTILRYNRGGAVWDTLYTGTMTPNVSELACSAGDLGTVNVDSIGSYPVDQWVDGQVGAQGPNGEYKSGKYADGSSYALSSDFLGRGAYYGDLLAASGAGSDKDSNNQDYEAKMKRHFLGASGLEGGIVGYSDWTGDDPSIMFSEAVNATGNETVNQTIPVNITMNATEEAS